MTIKNYNTELFLFEYFSAELTGRPREREALFFGLGETFLVPADELKKLFVVAESPQIADLNSLGSCNRYFRTKSYLAATGEAKPDEVMDYVASIKSSVVTALNKFKCAVSPDKTYDEITSALRYAAECGYVHAMRTLGLLQAENILSDRSEGIKRLRRVGEWNDLSALFMLMHYDGAEHLGALKLAAKASSANGIVELIERKFGKAPPPDDNRLILESMFKSGALDRSVYSPIHAEAIYSPVLDATAKRNLLIATGKAFESLVGDLPLHLAHGEPVSYDAQPLDSLPFKRDEESSAVKRWLGNCDLRGESYRPIAMCSDSLYMLDKYAAALHACMTGANVVRINVSDTDECYFLPTKNNIFLRNCRDDKVNVFLLYVCGNIGSVRRDRIKSFLRADGRARFMLDSPAVTLDLGDVLPVCFCDNTNVAELSKLCDTVYIADATRDEKLAIIDDIIAERTDAYGLKSVSLKKGAADKLVSLTVDELDCAIDSAVRARRVKDGKISLSADDFQCESHDGSIKFGFGFGG